MRYLEKLPDRKTYIYITKTEPLDWGRTLFVWSILRNSRKPTNLRWVGGRGANEDQPRPKMYFPEKGLKVKNVTEF